MMLPSTGNFKAINCPFFDSGLCERPYCHYKHVKKDASGSLDTSGEMLQQLVSEALKKVLKQKEMLPDTPLEIPADSIVSEVVDNLTPKTEDPETNTEVNQVQQISPVPSYKPTPIAELNKKRHIPVPYTPRNSSTVTRKSSTQSEKDASPKKRVKLEPELPHMTEYNPDIDTDKCVGYSPAATNKSYSSKHSYIPSSIATLKAPLADYVPLGVVDENATYKPSNSNQPEPEYRPISETPITSMGSYIPTDKSMLEELDLSTEFDMLDEIINDHSLIKNLMDSSINIDDLKGVDNAADSVIDTTMLDIFDSIKNGTNSSQTYSNNSSMKELNAAENEKNPTSVPSHRSSSHHKSRSKKSSKSEKHKDKHKEKISTSSSSKSKDSSKHKTSKSSSTNSSSSKSKKSSNTSSSHRSKSKSSHKSKKSSSSKDKSPKISIKKEEDSVGFDCSDNDADILNPEQSESDEEEIAKECFRIFQEYEPSASDSLKPKPQIKIEESLEVDTSTLSSSSKHRVAREGHHTMLSKSAAPPPRKIAVNPSQAMVQRYRNIALSQDNSKDCDVPDKIEVKPRGVLDHRGMVAKMKLMREVGVIEKSSRDGGASSSSQAGKLRIAHVPNVTSLLEAKSKVNTALEIRKKREIMIKKHESREMMLKKHESHINKSTTIAQTAKSLGGKRVAHIPSSQPKGLISDTDTTGTQRFPIAVRQKYIDMLVKEFSVVMSPDDALERALEEEISICQRVARKNMYNNAITATILQFRRERGLTKSYRSLDSIQHSKVLEGHVKGSWSVQKAEKVVIEEVNIYPYLEKYVLTRAELELNGFPFLHPVTSGLAIAKPMYEKELPFHGNRRQCIRCHKEYTIDKRGLQTNNEKCIYHPAKSIRSLYNCCKADVNTSGCASHDCHIFSTFKLNNTGFMKTRPCNNTPDDGDYGVYALDCEMVYTTRGIELARITVIDRDLRTVIDSFVQPPNPILDYATSFSGITAEMMQGVTKTLPEIQAALLVLFNDKTILIGHSLDSDLRVMKLVHETVVDTSVVYPHSRGPPFKKGLRTLAVDILGTVIQQNDAGHDSAEDAITSLKLMLHKVKEDLKAI